MTDTRKFLTRGEGIARIKELMHRGGTKSLDAVIRLLERERNLGRFVPGSDAEVELKEEIRQLAQKQRELARRGQWDS